MSEGELMSHHGDLGKIVETCLLFSLSALEQMGRRKTIKGDGKRTGSV